MHLYQSWTSQTHLCLPAGTDYLPFVHCKKETVIIISEKGVVTCMFSKMSQAYQTKKDLNQIDVHKAPSLNFAILLRILIIIRLKCPE